MPVTDPERRREIRRAYEARNPDRRKATKHAARTARREVHDVKFIGVDGEGVDRADGAHDYNLLSVGDRPCYFPDGRRLTTADIFEFLWRSTRDNPNAVYVGFFLGYDFAQWLRDLPEEHARALLTPEGIARRQRNGSGGNPTPFPVRWEQWEFDVLPNMKRFKLRMRYGDAFEGTKNPHRWLYVCDVGSFYQTSLLAAINPEHWPTPVCTEDEYEQIRAGKEARSDNLAEYGSPVDPDTIAYNALENDILSRLMTRTNEGLVGMGVKLSKQQWIGPGQAAQAWLKDVAREHTGQAAAEHFSSDNLIADGDPWPDHVARDDPSTSPFEAARAAYFGGWFEVMAHGPVPGVTHEYDINSAYPHIIADLPCLLHGSWTHGHHGLQFNDDYSHSDYSPYVLVEADVIGRNPHIGAMLHRTPKGGVLRPHRTRGWYWNHELVAALRAGLIHTINIHQWWKYQPCDCPPPFEAIRELYLHRLRVGKQTPQGRAMRLVYNSSYGKIAQSVGSPMFGNAVYASLITAGCRAMITDAIASHPEGASAVVMVATDGVYFSSPHPGLDVDAGRLGAWDAGTKRNLSLLKPGVYWDDKGREAVRAGARKLGLKSRGINERALAEVIDQFDEQWATFMPSPDPQAWPAVRLNIEFGVITARQALHRGKWHLAGAIQRDLHPIQSSAPHRKRSGPFSKKGGVLRSSPLANREGTPSTPYDKRFGLELRTGQEEMPMLPEGEASMLLSEILRIHNVHI